LVTFCLTGLHAFEHEGIQNITLLKDQLVTASHDQTPAILKRHADVIARYENGLLPGLVLIYVTASGPSVFIVQNLVQMKVYVTECLLDIQYPKFQWKHPRLIIKKSVWKKYADKYHYWLLV
jgi:hypothetical protein